MKKKIMFNNKRLMAQIGNVKKEDYIVDNYESDSTLLAGKYDGARASKVTENKSSRRGRCLIEPPARFDGISVHIRECSRYVTEAIVSGTRSCGIEIPYPEIRAVNSFDPAAFSPTDLLFLI